MKNRRSTLIAIFGPDGSGKTTVAELLENKYKKAGVRSLHKHWRPGLLPYRNRRSQEFDKIEFTNPHGGKSRGGIKGLLIFFYIVIDFILGYFILIRPRLQDGIIVIYERYYYDLIIDQKRYGLLVPLWIRKFVAALIPAPDTIILLDAPSDVLDSRKRELERDEIERQRLLMKMYLSRYHGFHIVDVGDSTPDEVTDIIFLIVKR